MDLQKAAGRGVANAPHVSRRVLPRQARPCVYAPRGRARPPATVKGANADAVWAMRAVRATRPRGDSTGLTGYTCSPALTASARPPCPPRPHVSPFPSGMARSGQQLVEDVPLFTLFCRFNVKKK